MKPRVLILPCPTVGGTLGTVGYLLAIAEHLRDRAEVLVHAPGYCADFMRDYGFAVSRAPLPQADKQNTIDVKDLIDAMLWMGLLDQDYIKAAVQSEIKAIRSFKPDVILSDFNLTAPLSAKYCGIPIVSLAAEPTHPKHGFDPQRYGFLAERFDEVCHELGLPRVEDTRELCFMRSDVPVVTSWTDFEPQLRDIPNVEYVGALVHTSQRHTSEVRWETDKKKVFTYLSISALPPRVYLPILRQAFPEEEFEVICSVGAGFDVEAFRMLVGHLRLVNWAPMDEIFPQADLVIYHGGQGTGMAAAIHQVPSIAITGQHYERRFNAERFEAEGIGCLLPTVQFRPHLLRTKFEKLQSPDVKAKLKEVSTTLQSLGGAAQAANIVLNHAIFNVQSH